MSTGIIARPCIESKILFIRGQKVMLDRDLAELYGVPTKSLNLAVKRNSGRFPSDFMFRLSIKEADYLRFQFETSKVGHGGPRYLPYAFTEQGVAMLSSALNSKRAVSANIAIMRAFVKLRETLSLHKDLAVKLKELESKVEGHGEYLHLRSLANVSVRHSRPKRKRSEQFWATNPSTPFSRRFAS